MGRDKGFSGKTVVITGAAGGMGRAFSHRFATAGATLGLLDSDGSSLDNLVGDLAEKGAQALAQRCDVTNETECEQAVSAVIERFGGVDVLVNNAGITHRSAFASTGTHVYRRVMDVNFFGSLHCTKAALPSLIERQGLIIVISSVAGFSPLYGRTGYAASKHALHGFFESLRAELKPLGVAVMIVCPGFTRTGISTSALDGDGFPTTHPQSTIGRIALPEDVAEAVYRAALKRRSFVVLSTVGRLTRLVTRLSPGLYAWIMARSLSSELDR
jgi:NAD(P)-dependent dehydrogenase (short-subunit alcohol dehydrogenase family)